MVLALTTEEAEQVYEQRQRQGFLAGPSPVVTSGVGAFYVVQLVPDLDPLRVKLGFATDVQERLAAHRTVAPTAKLIGSWPCRPSWERAAIDSITRQGCRPIGPEVFVCDDIDALLTRAEAFFAIMPSVQQ
jgi:hypothetical protein